MKDCFDCKGYISSQKAAIIGKIRKQGKLYFELGGKLLDDWHATRVLPGFKLDTKLEIIFEFKDEAELIICINSENIQAGRIRSDYNTLYVDDCMRLIKSYREMGFLVSGIAFTVFRNQPKAIEFANKLKKMGEKVYFLKYIPNYPNDFEATLKAFDESDDIETTRPLVIMTSSGSASGKLSACLCAVYQEFKKGKKVGYAKYDIFPVWDLPINHPINLAFKAATADSNDEIMVDSYYYEKYHKIVSNYNRDLTVFPTIQRIFKMFTGNETFSSPTEMVINTMRNFIVDDEAVSDAGRQEVCRRYLTYYKQYLRGRIDMSPIQRVEAIMNENAITMDCLPIVIFAHEIFNENKDKKMIVLQLKDGRYVVAEETDELSIGASILMEALRSFVPYNKNQFCVWNNRQMHTSDLLERISRVDQYRTALSQIVGCYAHCSYVIAEEEEEALKSIGIYITCEPVI